MLSRTNRSSDLCEQASNWLWNFLLAFFTPFIVSAIDFRYGYVFAGCNFLGGLIVFFFVMEGQGRTLEELDTMYIEKVIPWQSSSWVSPPPAEIARIRKAAGTHEHADLEAGDGLGRDDEIKDVPPAGHLNGANGANGVHDSALDEEKKETTV